MKEPQSGVCTYVFRYRYARPWRPVKFCVQPMKKQWPPQSATKRTDGETASWGAPRNRHTDPRVTAPWPERRPHRQWLSDDANRSTSGPSPLPLPQLFQPSPQSSLPPPRDPALPTLARAARANRGPKGHPPRGGAVAPNAPWTPSRPPWPGARRGTNTPPPARRVGAPPAAAAWGGGFPPAPVRQRPPRRRRRRGRRRQRRRRVGRRWGCSWCRPRRRGGGSPSSRRAHVRSPPAVATTTTAGAAGRRRHGRRRGRGTVPSGRGRAGAPRGSSRPFLTKAHPRRWRGRRRRAAAWASAASPPGTPAQGVDGGGRRSPHGGQPAGPPAPRRPRWPTALASPPGRPRPCPGAAALALPIRRVGARPAAGARRATPGPAVIPAGDATST